MRRRSIGYCLTPKTVPFHAPSRDQSTGTVLGARTGTPLIVSGKAARCWKDVRHTRTLYGHLNSGGGTNLASVRVHFIAPRSFRAVTLTPSIRASGMSRSPAMVSNSNSSIIPVVATVISRTPGRRHHDLRWSEHPYMYEPCDQLALEAPCQHPEPQRPRPPLSTHKCRSSRQAHSHRRHTPRAPNLYQFRLRFGYAFARFGGHVSDFEKRLGSGVDVELS